MSAIRALIHYPDRNPLPEAPYPAFGGELRREETDRNTSKHFYEMVVPILAFQLLVIFWLGWRNQVLETATKAQFNDYVSTRVEKEGIYAELAQRKTELARIQEEQQALKSVIAEQDKRNQTLLGQYQEQKILWEQRRQGWLDNTKRLEQELVTLKNLITNSGGKLAAVGRGTVAEKCIAGDCVDGFGTRLYASGETYQGHWQKGQRSGFGIHAYASGDVYKGEWQGDQRAGQGVMLFDNGDKWVGQWRDGQQFGAGSKYLAFLDNHKDVAKPIRTTTLKTEGKH